MCIGLLDCNNFFVSCERLFRPDLRNKPVVVLSSNDGCIVARSNEVKMKGVPMGIPYFKVKDELEQMGAHVFSSNFPLYRDISFRVMETLAREVSGIEQYSVDEAFFRLSDCSVKTLEKRARNVKRIIEQEVGVPVTIGIARTKTIAKCATELGKKDQGVCVLTGTTWQREMQTFPLSEVWGIGGKTAAKMMGAGLRTVADFVRTDPARVEQLFGIHGARLRLELTEQSSEHAHHVDLQQSIMSTRSFSKQITDRSVLHDAVAYHIAHAAEDLRKISACAQSVRVMILPSRHGDWVLKGGSREVILDIPTDDTRVLLTEAARLLHLLYEKGVPYKKAGVVLSRIVPKQHVAASLFGQPVDTSGLFEAIDQLNRRFGPGMLTVGRTRSTKAWSTNRAHISPRYTTEWDDIMQVVA